jgi:hypothetical protein
MKKNRTGLFHRTDHGRCCEFDPHHISLRDLSDAADTAQTAGHHAVTLFPQRLMRGNTTDDKT